MTFETLNPATAVADAIGAIDTGNPLIICGPPTIQAEFEYLTESAEKSVEETIQKGMEIDVDRWFSEQREALALDFDYESEADWEEVAGEWPADAPPEHRFTIASDIGSGEPLDSVVGVRIAADASTQPKLVSCSSIRRAKLRYIDDTDSHPSAVYFKD